MNSEIETCLQGLELVLNNTKNREDVIQNAITKCLQSGQQNPGELKSPARMIQELKAQGLSYDQVFIAIKEIMTDLPPHYEQPLLNDFQQFFNELLVCMADKDSKHDPDNPLFGIVKEALINRKTQ